jgi:hypothetical protein
VLPIFITSLFYNSFSRRFISFGFKELKTRQDELTTERVQVEADLVVEGVQHVEMEAVKAYAEDLRSLLEEADFTQSKTFLRSFVKKITINRDKAKIQYRLPMPTDGKRLQSMSVLPIDTLGGAGGIRTPYLSLIYRLKDRRKPQTGKRNLFTEIEQIKQL